MSNTSLSSDIKETFSFPKSLAFFVALGPFISLTFYILEYTVLTHFYYINEALHVLIEGVGCFIAMLVAAQMLLFEKHSKSSSYTTIIVSGLFAMGILDAFHAISQPGEYFVWMRSLAALCGGLIFSLVCLPLSYQSHISKRLPYWAIVLSFVSGIFFAASPQWIPQMLAGGAEFSFLAKNINIFSGVFMFFAAGRLVMSYLNHKKTEDIIFAVHCYFFGLSGIMFEYSQMWDAAWWGWHGVRLVAYFMALVFLIRVNVSLIRSAIFQDQKLKEFHRFQTIFDSYPGLTFLLDPKGVIIQVNAELKEMTGYENFEVLGKNFSDLIPSTSDAIDSFLRHQKDASLKHKNFGMTKDILMTRKNQSTLPIEMNLSSVRMEDGQLCLVAVIEDVTIRHKLEETRIASRLLENENLKLKKLALKDPLTGLLNRRGFNECFYEALADHKRQRTNYQLVLIDLDDFKNINDEYGYATGDIVLKEIVKAMGASIRIYDIFARLGGDEFLILLKNVNKAEGFVVVEKILNRIRSTRVGISNSRDIRVTASIGIESLSDELHSLDEVLQKLHFYLTASKRSGKDRVMSDSQSTSGHDDKKQVLSSVLLDEKNYSVLSQPIVDMRNGSFIGCEMLSRVSHPEFSMPDEFLSFARSNHILNTVDLICLKKCVGKSYEAPENYSIHVNLFPSSLVNFPAKEILSMFPENLQSRFCLEISEQQLLGDPYHLREKLKYLREGGLKIALDDFGFGYSSLESLVILEPDVVKIDKSFVRDVHLRKDKQAHLQRMISIIRSNGSEPVVEGVETEFERSVVSDFGVRYAQGYLFGKPNPKIL